MVFSPRILNNPIVQNKNFKYYKSATLIDEKVNDMLKTKQILEQRKLTTRSPEVLLRDQIMLKQINTKLNILGYNPNY